MHRLLPSSNALEANWNVLVLATRQLLRVSNPNSSDSSFTGRQITRKGDSSWHEPASVCVCALCDARHAACSEHHHHTTDAPRVRLRKLYACNPALKGLVSVNTLLTIVCMRIYWSRVFITYCESLRVLCFFNVCSPRDPSVLYVGIIRVILKPTFLYTSTFFKYAHLT